MKKFFHLFFVAVLFQTAVACSEKDNDKTPQWGVVEAFDDFLFKKYTPPIITRTLVFERNDDAKLKINKPFVLKLCRQEGDKTIPVTPAEVQVYVDGEAVADNRIVIAPGTERVQVGMKLDKNLTKKKDHTYRYVFQVENPGYELINGVEADKGIYVMDDLQTNVRIEVKHKANSLKVWCEIIGLLLLGLLVLWFLVLRTLFVQKIRLSRISINSDSYFKSARINGAMSVVFTKDRTKKQGFLSKLFVGKVVYIYDSWWTQDFVLMPGNGKTAHVSSCKGYVIDPNRTLKVGVEYTLTNTENNNVATITVS